MSMLLKIVFTFLLLQFGSSASDVAVNRSLRRLLSGTTDCTGDLKVPETSKFCAGDSCFLLCVTNQYLGYAYYDCIDGDWVPRNDALTCQRVHRLGKKEVEEKVAGIELLKDHYVAHDEDPTAKLAIQEVAQLVFNHNMHHVYGVLEMASQVNAATDSDAQDDGAASTEGSGRRNLFLGDIWPPSLPDLPKLPELPEQIEILNPETWVDEAIGLLTGTICMEETIAVHTLSATDEPCGCFPIVQAKCEWTCHTGPCATCLTLFDRYGVDVFNGAYEDIYGDYYEMWQWNCIFPPDFLPVPGW